MFDVRRCPHDATCVDHEWNAASRRRQQAVPQRVPGLFTNGAAWFSREETVKGGIAPGQHADFGMLDTDCLTVPDERIEHVASLPTVVAGKVTHAAKPIDAFAPRALPSVPRGRRSPTL
jgi:hypothetical protein